MQSLLGLIQMLAEASIRANERAKVTHERFNVFTTLLSAHDEVRLHTRFIHCLLDPQGIHDCHSLFLDLFFSTLSEVPCLDHDGNAAPFDPPEPGLAWLVRKEAANDQGQIDLLLERASFGIAIENKIYAGEQANQLTRYASYLNGRFGPNSTLIYLTLDGKPSATHGGTPYLRASYASHILAWLDKCLRETYRSIPINQVLLQYREVVRQLTGQTLDSALMDISADFITRHPDIVRFRKQILDAINTAHGTFLDRLAAGIIEELQPVYQTRLRSRLFKGSFGFDTNGALIITPPPESPLRGAPFEIWVESMYQWGNALIVGVESLYEKPPLSPEHLSLLKRMNDILDRESKAAHGQYHKADPLPTWKGTFWPTGWHNIFHPIDDEKLASLLHEPLPKIVAEVCLAIRHHIALLERAYIEASSFSLVPNVPAPSPPPA